LVDIFLSYAREDLTKAKQLAASLEKQGWTVFFDRTIPPGKTWRQFIGKKIDECRCMVVAWSTHSVNSHWVCEEADIGLNREILIPLLLDQVTPPLGFGSIQAANLVDWKGETDSSGYLALCNAITELIGPGMPSASSPAKTMYRPNKDEKTKVTDPKVSQRPLIRVIQGPLIKEPEMVKIPAGSFQMGSNNGEDNEKPVHSVRLKSFAIGRYPVTFDEYDQFAEAIGKPKPDDMGWGRGKRPVINVNWEEAVAYAQWLSDVGDKHFRLPTEAEWEYAARAGTTTDFYWDDQGVAKDFAWFNENSKDKTHPVGEKKPNAFGLYDMVGNVWEWAKDCWHDNYHQAPDDGSSWQEQKNVECYYRVLRGGSWNSDPSRLRSARRLRRTPGLCGRYIGFRLAQN
jgi:formylglycine-generating enzyme required for sulfatase activity